MSLTDPWLSTIQLISPDYIEWKDLVETGPKIKARLHKVNFRWRIRIEEDWSQDDKIGEHYYTFDEHNLDQRCNWAAEQLKDWKFVTRLSHQEWKFFNRKQAEKFLTIFSLKWAE